MNKYKLFLILLGLFCVVLVGASFMIAGTPVSQQAVSLDEIRMGNFTEIHTKVEDYYRKNQTMPMSLNDLEFTGKMAETVLIDPETKTIYEFKSSSVPYSYELCTTFSTNSSDTEESYYRYSENDLSHVKDYDCITYKISSYLLTPTPSAYIPPVN